MQCGEKCAIIPSMDDGHCRRRHRRRRRTPSSTKTITLCMYCMLQYNNLAKLSAVRRRRRSAGSLLWLHTCLTLLQPTLARQLEEGEEGKKMSPHLHTTTQDQYYGIDASVLYVHSTRQYEKLGRQEAKKALTIIMAIYAKHTACTTIASAVAVAAAAPQLPPWLGGHLPCRLVLVCLIFTTKTESVPSKFHINGKRKTKQKLYGWANYFFPEYMLLQC